MAVYGFLGLGIMGQAMAANLLKAGHTVLVWNRDRAKAEALVPVGAQVLDSPADVAAHSEITFAMLADPEASQAVCFGPDGVLAGIRSGAGYVDMSTVDDSTASTIGKAIHEKGARFLEAPVSGTKKPAIDGTLLILAAGDESLYEEATPAFDIMGKKTIYLGDVSNAARMKLVINMIMGGMMTAFCEGLALGQKVGLDGSTILDALASGALANPMFAIKGPLILNEQFSASFPLKHMQKDLRLALELGTASEQELPTATAANEWFKMALEEGSGDQDFAAVWNVIGKKKG